MNSSRILAALAAASLLAMVGCNRGEEQAQAPGPQQGAQVTVAAAMAKDVPIYLEEIGKTLPVESVSIVPQVAGKIMAAKVEDGMTVKKGDLLFEIDPRPFEAALASEQATLQQYKAELELAKTEYARMQSLVSKSAVSQLEVDQKKSAQAVAEGKIAWSEAAILTAKLNLDYTKIFSPIEGRAGARLVDPGNIVKANEGSLLVIQRLNPIYAEFTITENELGTVRKYIAASGLDLGATPEKGLKAMVDLPGDAQQVLEALGKPAATQPGKNKAGPREGTLTFLDNSVQNGTGTVRLRATLPNPDNYFWPGQFVKVKLVLTTRKNAVLIPTQAQQIGQQGPYVYVVKEGEMEMPDKSKVKAMLAQLRPIVPGQRQGDMVVVDSGLAAGEQVIITGQMMVMPGGPVTVVKDANAAPNVTAAAE